MSILRILSPVLLLLALASTGAAESAVKGTALYGECLAHRVQPEVEAVAERVWRQEAPLPATLAAPPTWRPALPDLDEVERLDAPAGDEQRTRL